LTAGSVADNDERVISDLAEMPEDGVNLVVVGSGASGAPVYFRMFNSAGTRVVDDAVSAHPSRPDLWGESVAPEGRIAWWLDRADSAAAAQGWKPSSVLFRNSS